MAIIRTTPKDLIADHNRELESRQPSEIDLCDHCKGKCREDCRIHGIAAANARQNAFLRDWQKRHGTND